jgi:hypothetical protein
LDEVYRGNGRDDAASGDGSFKGQVGFCRIFWIFIFLSLALIILYALYAGRRGIAPFALALF